MLVKRAQIHSCMEVRREVKRAELSDDQSHIRPTGSVGSACRVESAYRQASDNSGSQVWLVIGEEVSNTPLISLFRGRVRTTPTRHVPSRMILVWSTIRSPWPV